MAREVVGFVHSPIRVLAVKGPVADEAVGEGGVGNARGNGKWVRGKG